jgi:hypothetical protein
MQEHNQVYEYMAINEYETDAYVLRDEGRSGSDEVNIPF